MKEIELVEYYKNLETVVELYAQGFRVGDIHNKTGFSRLQIEDFLATFRQHAQQDPVIRERAKEVVRVVDVHYSEIVRAMHKAIEEADFSGDYKAKLTGLKGIADVEAKRVELLQKAGMLAENTIGDQIVDMEKKQKALIEILREVTGKCNHCKMEVSKRLSAVTGKVEAVIINES
jgi:hypothetical protein